MRREKLGQLVLAEPAADVPSGAPPFWRGWIVLSVVVLGLAGGILWAVGWLPAQAGPSRLTIRGLELTPAEDVLAAVQAQPGRSWVNLWRSSRDWQAGNERWLSAVSLRPLGFRAATLVVEERRPLLPVLAAGKPYWLCDDGQLVGRDKVQDSQGVFNRLASLPQVELAELPAEQFIANSAALIELAGCLRECLQGVVGRILIDHQGEITLVDRQGLRILLGAPEQLPEKVAGLPQALRLSEADRAALLYLDCRDPSVFYQKWRERPAVAADKI